MVVQNDQIIVGSSGRPRRLRIQFLTSGKKSDFVHTRRCESRAAATRNDNRLGDESGVWFLHHSALTRAIIGAGTQTIFARASLSVSTVRFAAASASRTSVWIVNSGVVVYTLSRFCM